MKMKWACPHCGKLIVADKGAVLSHMREAHSQIYDNYPNPLAPTQNLIWESE